jgi:hypothetical protein
MDAWEYLFVTAVSHDGTLRPCQVNGQELAGWEQITIQDYIRQVGEQGWELSGVVTSESGVDQTTRLSFKRPSTEPPRVV